MNAGNIITKCTYYLCAVMLIGMPALSQADDEGRGSGKRVAGSYLIENLSIPDAGLEGLQAMANLTADGGVIATDSDDFGLAATGLVAIGYGEEQLKNLADPASGENRRVQISNLVQ